MIKRLVVKDLNNKHNFDLTFYEDLNLFTGKNGSGKTTLLKLIWYLASGNLGQLFREISFSYLKFEADGINAEFTIIEKQQKLFINGHYEVLERSIEIKDEPLLELNYLRLSAFQKVVFEVNHIESIFFPTFRRIEGGFSIGNYKDERIGFKERLSLFGENRDLNEIFDELSRRISPNEYNKFIASISTQDIIKLLNDKYTEILEKIRALESEQSVKILSQIKKDDKDPQVIASIKQLVENTDAKKKELMRPFAVLSHLIQEIFMDKSIQITKTLTLGEAKEAIASDKLSAGEKQMLSFLCYNFFSDNTAIFIDEPELSLHTDWQRILFPTLLEQSTNNQFFVATHSPFIYSKYPDKEHILDTDRGDTL